MHVHDTYFVIAHFHFIMVGGMVMAYMGGLHYWWPKMTGRMYSEWWSRLAALIIFVGFFLTFLPQFVVGYNGMPRRYHQYVPEFQVWNVLSTAGARSRGRLRVAVVILALSLRYGSRPGQSVASDGAGVADRLAAAARQLRRNADRRPRPLRIPPGKSPE